MINVEKNNKENRSLLCSCQHIVMKLVANVVTKLVHVCMIELVYCSSLDYYAPYRVTCLIEYFIIGLLLTT